jgi:hypothetical protein
VNRHTHAHDSRDDGDEDEDEINITAKLFAMSIGCSRRYTHYYQPLFSAISCTSCYLLLLRPQLYHLFDICLFESGYHFFWIYVSGFLRSILLNMKRRVFTTTALWLWQTEQSRRAGKRLFLSPIFHHLSLPFFWLSLYDSNGRASLLLLLESLS